MPKNLNPQQKLAAEARYLPLLIVAGAGTGKTRTLTSRLIHFIDGGVPPEKICAITFTNKAAKEMADRVTTTTTTDNDDNSHGQPFIGTFHALGARILRQEGHLFDRRRNFVIFDDRDSFELVKKIVKKMPPVDEEVSPQKNKTRADREKPSFFVQKISEIKNTDARSADDAVSKIFRAYEKKLKENNAFDFDDLIEKVVLLFKKYPRILKKYQKKFDAILVDEYQDLNPKQYELIKLLAGDHRNISVVGDDEQMIYGWRYANLGTFLNFEKDWPGAQIAYLEENYRSSGNIIRAASAVAENNQYRRPKNLWTKKPEGSPIAVVETLDEDEEAGWIAGKISKSEFPTSEQSLAILYRTNAQSRAIEQALIERKIPYQIFGGLKFYERREIKDIVAALRYALNQNDEISRDRLAKNISRGKFLELTRRLEDTEKNGLEPTKLIEIFLKTTDYLSHLEKNFVNHAERQENIAELVNFASRFNNLARFLEEIALVQASDTPATDRGLPITINSVQLMTIHLAKGLEFDRVFIAGCSEGLLPHARSIENEYQLEEERRLMYVAMTRAKKDLAISFYDLPSRFLGEIPNELVEFQSTIGDGEEGTEDRERYVILD